VKKEIEPQSQKLNKKPSKKAMPSKLKLGLIIAGTIALLAAVFYGLYIGLLYAASPVVVRNPKLEHYHFRMQIVVNGKKENFAEDKYQKGYVKDQCNAALPEQPIHFHDQKDQFTHIHWEGMTGGMVMKYYGWNFIGGFSNVLGYKLDNLRDIQKVTTHGNYLPKISKNAKIHVFTGDEKSYQERKFEDWKSQDLEKFFEKTSNAPAHEINKQTSLLDKIFPTANAHGDADDGKDGEPGETQEQKLTRINNMLGNVVLFVQDKEPTDQQVRERFNNLEPLTDSTCGG
jgi:hypothetical protein